jgi:hypothetical protein
VPAEGAGGVFAGKVHVVPDTGGPHPVSFAGDPNELHSIVFTPQGPNDVLLAVMVEGSCSAQDPGARLVVEVYLDVAGVPTVTESVDLPEGPDAPYLISLPLHGSCLGTGGTLPTGGVGVRVFAEVPDQIDQSGLDRATVTRADLKLVWLEDVSVEDPSTRAAPNALDRDQDQDGWTPRQGDCDDADAAVHPGALDLHDGVDMDCDGRIELQFRYWRDADQDGWGDPGDSVLGWTQPTGYVRNFQDCDDTDASVNPYADEIPGDGIDNNCNGYVDETEPILFHDADGDGFGGVNELRGFESWPEHVRVRGDCHDNDVSRFPGAKEFQDGVDSNCDGEDD